MFSSLQLETKGIDYQVIYLRKHTLSSYFFNIDKRNRKFSYSHTLNLERVTLLDRLIAVKLTEPCAQE